MQAPNTNKEKRTFEKGVDMDSAIIGIEDGFARYMLNCLVDEGVNITNIKGNLVAEFEEDFPDFNTFPNYNYLCLGSKYDPIFKKTYFFVSCLDNNDESPVKSNYIFEYDVESGIVYVVCDSDWSSILDFEPDELITGISIVHIDTDKPLLYWTQKAGLRKINVYKAKLLFSSGGTDPLGYSAASIKIIERIKYPASFAPQIAQLTDIGFIGNNIQKGFFQFSTRNVYDDYEKSVPSDWSRVNIPYFPYEVITNDVPLFQESQRNNVIWITIKKPFEIVEKIEIIVREKTSTVGTEVNYDWRIYDTLIVSDITWNGDDEYIYKFYNDKIGKLITQKQANSIFDNVPLAAVADAFGEDSRMYEANITEGFNLEAVDVDVSHTATPFLDVTDAEYIDLFVYQELPFSPLVDGGTGVLPNDPADMQAGGTISFQFDVASIPAINGEYNFQYILTEADLDPDNYPTLLLTNMQVAFNNFIPPNLAPYLTFIIADDIDLYTFYIEDVFPPMGSPIGDELISAFYKFDNNCLPQFKNRHVHYLGIGYGDAAGRRSSVQKISKYYLSDALENVLKLRFTINHIPPSWATQYYIYYAGFDAGNYYQTKVSVVGSLLDDNTRACTVDWLQTQYKFNEITYLKYQYSEGDRIKFLFASTDGEVDDIIDLAILYANETSTVVNVENSSWLTSALETNSSFIVEIYKKAAQTELYYTIDKNDIGNVGSPTRYHKGNIQDQSSLSSPNPAIQEFSGVNTYIRPRYMQDNYIQNVYLLNDYASSIAGYTNIGSTSFITRLYIYKDEAQTQLIATFERTIPMTIPGVSYQTQINDELILYWNESTASNWVANDPSYTAFYFLNNYDSSVASDLRITIAQRLTSVAPKVYFSAYATGNNTTDSIIENGIYVQNPSGTSEIKYIEDPNQSDLYVGVSTGDGSSISGSAVTSFGKPNIVNDNFRQVTRENTIWFSEQLIPESNTNGLSSFPDGQFRDYSQSFGGIQKFVVTDRALKVGMELRWGWIPINQQVNASGAEQTFTLNSSTVLTEMIYYEEKRGVGKHPESVVEFAGAIYGLDPITGCIYRISRDGFTIISDVKNQQGNYLVRQSLYDAIKAHTGNFWGGFNERRNSYEINIGGTVMVWDEEGNSWVGGRSYDAECFGSAGVDLVSFYNGRLYLHEANELRNNFYGVQYTSKVWVPGNWMDFKKIYKSLILRSETIWYAYDILNDVGQKSIIDKLRFSKREGMWYAAFRRDMNTVNVVNPIVDGKQMRDTVILLKMENDSVEYEWLNFVIINQIESK